MRAVAKGSGNGDVIVPDFSNQSAENENISIGLASKVPLEQTLYNKIL